MYCGSEDFVAELRVFLLELVSEVSGGKKVGQARHSLLSYAVHTAGLKYNISSSGMLFFSDKIYVKSYRDND